MSVTIRHQLQGPRQVVCRRSKFTGPGTEAVLHYVLPSRPPRCQRSLGTALSLCSAPSCSRIQRLEGLLKVLDPTSRLLRTMMQAQLSSRRPLNNNMSVPWTSSRALSIIPVTDRRYIVQPYYDPYLGSCSLYASESLYHL